MAWTATPESDTVFLLREVTSCKVQVTFLENDEYTEKTEVLTLVAGAWE